MTGFMHMETSAVAGAMRALSAEGQQLGTAWQGCKSAIAGNEGGIASDQLGQAFRRRYDVISTALRERADRLPLSIMDDADIGMRCVGEYRTADEVAAAAISGIDAGGDSGGSAVPGAGGRAH
jgi:hypothetical protein